MLAPTLAIEGTTEKLFLQSLRENAIRLPISDRWAIKQYNALVERCSRELGLDRESIEFLVHDAKVLRAQRAVRRAKDRWNTRLAKLGPGFSGRPRVVVLIPDGQAMRSFLLADVCRKICAWADVFVLSPLDISSQVAGLGPQAVFLPVANIRRTRFDTLVGYLGYRQTESPTNKRFVERLDENLQKALAGNDTLESSLRVWQIAKGLLSQEDYIKAYCWSLRFFSHLYALKDMARLLGRLQPDLVFNTSFVPWSARLWTRAAALNGTPVISNVISWDNMSTKTLLDEFAQTYLIWSDEMDEDFSTSLPFLRKTSRVIVGSPQFEPIVQGRGLVPRAEFLQRHGLDPGKKLILYTTGSKTLFPREAECLDTVLTHWRDNLRERANIMVRMHPKDREGRYESVREKFPEVPFTLAGHNLASDDDWVPTEEDIALLVNQLHHCDVVVNVASTMTIEGFAIDKPAINIGFSLGLSVSARYPMEDYYKSRHNCDVVDSGAARLVSDYEQLFAAIDAVLDRNDYDVATQRGVLTKKCKYFTDSSDRINGFLQKFVAEKVISVPLPLRRLRWVASRLMARLRAA